MKRKASFEKDALLNMGLKKLSIAGLLIRGGTGNRHINNADAEVSSWPFDALKVIGITALCCFGFTIGIYGVIRLLDKPLNALALDKTFISFSPHPLYLHLFANVEGNEVMIDSKTYWQTCYSYRLHDNEPEFALGGVAKDFMPGETPLLIEKKKGKFYQAGPQGLEPFKFKVKKPYLIPKGLEEGGLFIRKEGESDLYLLRHYSYVIKNKSKALHYFGNEPPQDFRLKGFAYFKMYDLRPHVKRGKGSTLMPLSDKSAHEFNQEAMQANILPNDVKAPYEIKTNTQEQGSTDVVNAHLFDDTKVIKIWDANVFESDDSSHTALMKHLDAHLPSIINTNNIEPLDMSLDEIETYRTLVHLLQ